jgi:hypothetical protein
VAGRAFKLTAPVVPEDDLQQAVYSALRVLLPNDAVITAWDHSNAASAAEGARKRRLGAQRGWPDLGIFHAGRLVLLELKRERGGYLSPAQRALHLRLVNTGFPVAVCHTVVEALDAVSARGIRLRGRIAA